MRCIALGFLALGCTLSAQTITIRMGTLAPRNSRWHQLLIAMGDKWKAASGGKVELRIYPGGEQGDEPEMVQKMRLGELQSVAISGAGLSGIDASASALQIPMMYDSWSELDYVRDRIDPGLEIEEEQFARRPVAIEGHPGPPRDPMIERLSGDVIASVRTAQ
jgi:TRAP-type transport system periplasmic protein